MFFNEKKFTKEIQKLPKILDTASLSMEKQEQIKQNVLLAIKKQEIVEKGNPGWSIKLVPLMRYALLSLLGISLVGGTAFAASGNARPGDILYPVKLAKEKVQLKLAVSQTNKVELKAKFAQTRLAELQELSAAEEPVKIKPSISPKPKPIINQQATTTVITSSTPVVIFPATGPAIKDDNIKVRIAAQKEAQAEVKDAIKELRGLRQKLKKEGNKKGAEDISNNINNLKIQAESQHVKVEDQSGDNSGDDKN